MSDKKLSDTLMLKMFKSNQETKSGIKIAIVGGIAVALFTMIGSWTVWMTNQGFKAKVNEKEIIELKEKVSELEKFKSEVLSKIVWVE